MNTLRARETRIFNKINPLVSFSVTRYVLAVGIFVAVAIFGIVSTLGLGVDLLPNIVIPAGMSFEPPIPGQRRASWTSR